MGKDYYKLHEDVCFKRAGGKIIWQPRIICWINDKMFDYGKIDGKLCIRTPEDGDYITIDSKGSRKKLSRVFIDNKIDREKRKTWPVLALGQEIIWVLGLRYNEAYKLGENTKKVMYISSIGKGE